MRRRAQLGYAALALTVAALLAGCGGGGSGAEAQVKKTVDGFTAAVGRHDFEAACKEVNPRLEALLKAEVHGSCAAGLKKELSVGDELGSLAVEEVAIRNRAAVVGFAGPSGITFELSQSPSDGRWQISSF